MGSAAGRAGCGAGLGAELAGCSDREAGAVNALQTLVCRLLSWARCVEINWGLRSTSPSEAESAGAAYWRSEGSGVFLVERMQGAWSQALFSGTQRGCDVVCGHRGFWRYSESVCTWLWVASSGRPCLSREVGLDRPRGPCKPRLFRDSLMI